MDGILDLVLRMWNITVKNETILNKDQMELEKSMYEYNGLPLLEPKITPKLDPHFRPAVLANHEYNRQVEESGDGVPVDIALERSQNSISRFSTKVFPTDHPSAKGNFIYVERLIKFLLWSRGAGKIYLSGPSDLADRLAQHYTSSKTGQFDAQIMGEKIYQTSFEIIQVDHDSLPEEKADSSPLGGHLQGCRIGFDLGASDRKVAAVIDGKVVFSEEVPWDPVSQTDPQWHFDEVMDSLNRAAKHLPRVDAIGGSSAGVYVENQVRVASLFRGIPAELFKKRIKPLFLEIKKAWKNIPFEIANDGNVTALAGALSIKDNGVLGIAMGSSEAAGYVDTKGILPNWLNELAFSPIDYNPKAATDEWSGDLGCGVQYFSQQGVGRLLSPAKISLDSGMGLPEKLEKVQELMSKGDEQAADIYKTIGTYLGYAVSHYSDFYDINYLLILGRVTTGQGGEIIKNEAKDVLKEEFPSLQERITFHVPDEKEKRHGQAIAAASLPML